MPVVTVTRHVDAPRTVVWDVLTDLDHAPQVMEAIARVERVDGEGFGLGTRWRETRTMFGRDATEEMEVTAIDPPRGYVVEADGQGAHYRTEFTLDEDADGTQVTMTFGAEPRGVTGRLMAATVGRLFAGATRRAVAADLADVARASEARAG